MLCLDPYLLKVRHNHPLGPVIRMADIISNDPLFFAHNARCHIFNLLPHILKSPALWGLEKIYREIFIHIVADASPSMGHAHCIKKAYYDNI
jgi:hypothetical protein